MWARTSIIPWGLSRKLTSVFIPSRPLSYPKTDFQMPAFQPDLGYILNQDHHEAIRGNIQSRKGVGDLDLVLQLAQTSGLESDEFLEAARRLPNGTHPEAQALGPEPQMVHEVPFEHRFEVAEGEKVTFHPFEKLAKNYGGLRNHDLGHYSGERTYYLLDQLAEMEQALINYSLDRLERDFGFELISVPDLLHPELIEGCGMTMNEDRTQVYTLESGYGPQALSGTAEMAIAGYFMNRTVPQSRKLCAVSRCFRAETTKRQEEKGIYRVHQFTKVEMFAVTEGHLDRSQAMLDHFLDTEQRLFSDLGLAYRVLHMPAHELGAPAYQKFDIEALLPGRGGFGEISSCSNCTDYQSRRLNIRDGSGLFCHTVNGTACAVPRMIMSILEQFQKDRLNVDIPELLQPYMRNRAKNLVLRPKNQRLKFQFIQSPKKFVNTPN